MHVLSSRDLLKDGQRRDCSRVPEFADADDDIDVVVAAVIGKSRFVVR